MKLKKVVKKYLPVLAYLVYAKVKKVVRVVSLENIQNYKMSTFIALKMNNASSIWT